MVARAWRSLRLPSGPHPIREADISRLNDVFSEAFTDRYRRDGLAGVRVPNLNPAVWKFAIADAGRGAMLWRDDRGNVVAFNVAHLSGTEAWMGPLAVHPDYQAHGLGKTLVSAGIEYLKGEGAKVIGLETMPRTMDNIGFYSSLGLNPGYLTLTVTIEGEFAAPLSMGSVSTRLGSLDPSDADKAVASCLELTRSMLPGYDFTREIRLTEDFSLGDTVMISSGGELTGFAICHSVPLVEGRLREELRVLKLVAKSDEAFDDVLTVLSDHARRSGIRRLAVRVQSVYTNAYRRMINRGGKVRWSDLRMTLNGYEEPRPAKGIVLSNWEI